MEEGAPLPLEILKCPQLSMDHKPLSGCRQDPELKGSFPGSLALGLVSLAVPGMESSFCLGYSPREHTATLLATRAAMRGGPGSSCKTHTHTWDKFLPRLQLWMVAGKLEDSDASVPVLQGVQALPVCTNPDAASGTML